MKKFYMAMSLRSLVVLSLMTGIAQADPIVTFEVGPMMDALVWQDQNGETVENGNQHFEGQKTMMNMWDFSYNITANEDPFINAQFAFQNNSLTTQTFVLNATIPITPAVVPSSLIGGSFGGSLTDANFDGNAVLSSVMGTPIYNGQIDGSGVLPIYPHATSFSASLFPGQTVNIPAANVGLPGPSIPGPAALTSIGINHVFTLTPGDSVSFTSFFVVIPEPASASLLLFVSGGIFFVRRFFIS